VMEGVLSPGDAVEPLAPRNGLIISVQQPACYKLASSGGSMDTKQWRHPTTDQVAWRRARGWRHINAWRQFNAVLRRREIVRLLMADGRSMFDRGVQSDIAKRFGVHRSTVHRDLWPLLAEANARRMCPLCGTRIVPVSSGQQPRRAT